MMTDTGNMKKLKDYLVGKGEDSYLFSSNNNNKTMMLSGVWGSGKTHFWQNQIIPELKNENIPNHYISLYGKTSLEQIKNEIFIKVFESIDSYEIVEKSVNVAKNTTNLVSSFSKAVEVFGFSVDLSKVTDKPFDHLEKMLDDKKLKKTEQYLNSGAIICFDDFERKSKDIDLNDLFGFISQLTIEFNCKVVIILNDDVFEGEEKKVFSNVKEKTVSKFLYFNPSIDELFNIIYNSNKKYKDLDEYKEKILETIEETKELNARIYIQILDNLIEWEKTNKINEETVRCLILVNINFILYHTIFILEEEKNIYIEKSFNNKFPDEIYSFNSIKSYVRNFDSNEKAEFSFYKTFNEYYNNLETYNIDEKRQKYYREFLEKNKLIIKSIYFVNKMNISKHFNNNYLQKINNFIETGIL